MRDEGLLQSVFPKTQLQGNLTVTLKGKFLRLIWVGLPAAPRPILACPSPVYLVHEPLNPLAKARGRCFMAAGVPRVCDF